MACEQTGHWVYLGLGSNLGNREDNLRQGLQQLAAAGLKIQAVSSLYETAPWGGVEQPDFYNLAAACLTNLEPMPLLKLAKEVEAAVGRQPGERWGPRVLDIDILLYDEIRYEEIRYEELTFSAGGLIIPHKEMCNRAFVLAPLLEIAPEIKIPGLEGNLAGLLAALPEEERQSVHLVGTLNECGTKGVKGNEID